MPYFELEDPLEQYLTGPNPFTPKNPNQFPDIRYHNVEQFRRSDAQERQRQVLQRIVDLGIGEIVTAETGFEFPIDQYTNTWDPKRQEADLEGKWSLHISVPNVPKEGVWDGIARVTAQRNEYGSTTIDRGRRKRTINTFRSESVQFSIAEGGHLNVTGEKVTFDESLQGYDKGLLFAEQKPLVAEAIKAAFAKPAIRQGTVRRSSIATL